MTTYQYYPLYTAIGLVPENSSLLHQRIVLWPPFFCHHFEAEFSGIFARMNTGLMARAALFIAQKICRINTIRFGPVLNVWGSNFVGSDTTYDSGRFKSNFYLTPITVKIPLQSNGFQCVKVRGGFKIWTSKVGLVDRSMRLRVRYCQTKYHYIPPLICSQWCFFLCFWYCGAFSDGKQSRHLLMVADTTTLTGSDVISIMTCVLSLRYYEL